MNLLFVCLQVLSELSQKTEKLHVEASLKQQLSEEYEQVSAVDILFLFFLECMTRHTAPLN